MKQNSKKHHRLEFYESDEETENDNELKAHVKSWNILDGMTSAINTQKSEHMDNQDGMDGFSNNKLQLIDIVENIDDLSLAT
jgi:hypothetical protein